MEKEAYCPICDKTFIVSTNNSWTACPVCGHHCAVKEPRNGDEVK